MPCGRGRQSLLFVVVVAVSATRESASFADEPAVPATTDELEEVRVHGSSAGGFSSRATIEDSPREVTDLASLVEPLPGVHVRRLGAEDSFATMSIRGSSSNEVVIILAGVPLTGGADPSLDLGTLPLWPGAHARVYRTFAPAALGPGSLGGTLALDPPTAGGAAHTEEWGAVGSFGAARLRIGDVREMDGGLRVATALSASRADDDFSYYDPTHGAFATRQNNGHAAANGLLSVALPVPWGGGAEGTFTVTTLLQARHQELAGNILSPTPFSTLDSNRELLVLELTRGAERGSWYLRGWGRRDDLELSNPLLAAATQPRHTDDGILALGGALGWRGRIAHDVHLDARLDSTGERYAPGTYVPVPSTGQPAGATRGSAGGGADLGWDVSRGSTVTASGRLDALSDQSDGSPSRGEVHPTAHLGGETSLGPATFAAHGGALARPPSFLELYGNQGAVVGNAKLQSESAWSVDAGGHVGTRGPIRVDAELAGFATWAQNLILFVAYGAQNVVATNIGKARIFGAEADVRAQVYGLELRAAYTALLTFNDAECVNAPPGCTAPPLPGRPANDVVADVSYKLGPATFRYGVDVVSGIRADEAGTTEVPARALHSVGAHLDVPGVRGLRVGFDVRNLFDLRTVTYAGVLGANGQPTASTEPIGDLYAYPLPGRSVLFTARWVSAPPPP